jgi:CheY-like chemotaxis protein
MTTYREMGPRGLNVLVIEDETLVSIDLEIMLEEMGHRVAGVAPHRRGAVSLIERLGDRIDCALLDTELALKSSRPVAERLRRAHIPYVVMDDGTGCDDDAPCVAKPLDARALRAGLARAAARRQALARI